MSPAANDALRFREQLTTLLTTVAAGARQHAAIAETPGRLRQAHPE
jgi:hypothetical protein